MKGLRVICIGDTHANWDYDNKRFAALGEFCAQEQPDVIVQIGDWADVSSLNTHGSKLELEGARWKDDVEVTRDSLAAFMRPILRRKRKMPHRIITLGNHEHRINRWLAQEPRFVGTMSVADLGFEEFGFHVFPFGREATVAGFQFVHHLGSNTGRAAAINSPSNGVKSVGVSTVVGHSHTTQLLPVYYKDRTVWGLDLGCAIHKDMGHSESWSHPTAHKYRRGVWVLENAANGDADFHHVRLETLNV